MANFYKKLIRSTVLLAICFSLSACASTQIENIGAGGNFKIEEDEARMWKRSQELDEVLTHSGYIYQDEQLNGYVNGVLHKLTGELERSNNVKLQAYILKDPLFNAFCLPSGSIYLHSSILANSENEAQLATVLGHEASHFFCRHSLKEFRSTINKTAFLSFWTVALSGGGLATLLGQYAIVGSIYGYSRTLENEADEKGFELVKNAGYDISESKKFMEKLYAATKDEDKVPYFYSSHPSTQHRIKLYDQLIKNAYKNEGAALGGITNEKEYNAAVKSLILDNVELDLKRDKGLIAARQQIDKYIVIEPGDARAYCILGRLCILEKKKDAAQEAFKKSIELSPDYADSHRELGLLFYKNGDKQTAKSEFEKYLELAPNAKDIDYIRRYLNG